MLFTYWLFHVIFTLPPTFLLYVLLRPMLSSRETFRLSFLVIVAVTYTLPWDSYIIKNKAWGYPDWSVLFTFFDVPAEEIFFFVIQTFFTTFIYTLFTMPIIPSLYILPGPDDLEYSSPIIWKFLRWGPSIAVSILSAICWLWCQPANHLFYLTATGAWALPVCGGLWALGGDHVIRRPYSIIISIILPTFYLSFTDTVAIRNGTWFISPITSTGIFVAPHLPLEEFAFFTITNVLLVLGLATIEKFDAFADTWPEVYRESSGTIQSNDFSAHATTSFRSQFHDLTKTIHIGTQIEKRSKHLTPTNSHRIEQLNRTLEVLSVASKSFYSASFIFPNFCAIRSKFVILYGFCRETDDLIDNATDKQEARRVVQICKEFLDLIWPPSSSLTPFKSDQNSDYEGLCNEEILKSEEVKFQVKVENFIQSRVPESSRPTFLIFSTLRKILIRRPFDELISGYEYDSIEYVDKEIKSEEDLMQYSRWVAGSIGEMCVSIMWWVYGAPQSEKERQSILLAANEMGCALQLINIARDVKEDAKIGRIYVPKVWFEGQVEGLKMLDWENLKNNVELDKFPYEIVAEKLLDIAHQYQNRSRKAIEQLPLAFRPGIRAATRVYLEIGRKIRSKFQVVKSSSSTFEYQASKSKTNHDLKLGTESSIANSGRRQLFSKCQKYVTNFISCGAQDSHRLRWNGDRIFLTRFQRLTAVARELWGLGRN